MAIQPQLSAQQQAAQVAQQAQAQNSYAKNLILSTAIYMKQPIYQRTTTPAQDPVLRISPTFAGLGIGFWVQVDASFSNTGSTAATPTSSFAAANILSNITFYDLNQQQRINTTGAHVELVNTYKSKYIYGSSVLAVTGEDSPIPYGSNFNVISQSSSIAASGTGTLRMIYFVPLMYTPRDMRGGIWLGVNNATCQLQLTINPTPFVVNTGDTTQAVFTGASTANASITGYTVKVIQHYYDQVPQGAGGPVLPGQDVSVAYQLLNTNFSGATPNVEFPMMYSNYRQFLSTVAIYNNNGSTGRAVNDAAYWALQSANFTNVWKLEDSTVALQSRNIIGADPPIGVRYFSSREKPIATNQYGNMQLILNPTTAAAGNYCNVLYEFFTLIQTISQAGSLASY
jgi:hypothetical protein